uniref:phage baseplate assembly protein V n=1 Tax=Flavobacterium sp. TaxID=239 RepID=UPI003751C2E3
AIPENSLCPPYGNVLAVPIATTQPATVMDNNDPKGLGRIQVQMAWQKNNSEKTPWIRMTNPHAGGGKGMYFIPEIGEEVLVAFEADNAEKPFILGAMYNGNESSGYNTEGNDQKVIHTRSGTKIIMNDAIGSVFIEDPSGNTWMMDGKGNINVNAPNDFTVNAGKNISFTAGMNINSSATLNISENAGVDKSTSVGMMHNMFVGGNSIMNVTGTLTEYITGNVESHTEKDRITSSQKGIESNSEDEITKHSKKEVQVNSAEKSKLF